jgi:hypothetical protein
MSRTLAVMARMRHLVLEEARQNLAACLQAEAAAEAAAREEDASIAREHRLATEPETDDALVEAYAAWLPTGRARRDQARAAAERATAVAAQARAQLNAARAAAEAVARRIAAAEAAEAEAAGKREQAALDEIGQSHPAEHPAG